MSPALLIMYLGGTVVTFSVAATAALIPSIAEEFSVSNFLAGRIIWAYMLAYGSAALLYGPLSRKVDIKRINAICFFAFFVFNLLAAFSQSIGQLFALRFLVGLVASCSTPMVLIYIADTVAKKERGRSVGLFFGCAFASSLLGLFLSGIINWRFIYLIPAVAGLTASFLFMFSFPRQKARSQDFDMHYIKALSQGTVFRIFALIFLASMFYHSIQQWLGVYFNQVLYFSQFRISMLLMLVSVSGVCGEIFGGHLSDKIGRVRTMRMGIFLMSLALFLLPLVAIVPLIILILLLWGFGWTVKHSGSATFLTDLPSKYIPESASLNSSVRFLSGGLGACLGGFLVEKSFNLTFFGIGAVLLALAYFAPRILKQSV